MLIDADAREFGEFILSRLREDPMRFCLVRMSIDSAFVEHLSIKDSIAVDSAIAAPPKDLSETICTGFEIKREVLK